MVDFGRVHGVVEVVKDTAGTRLRLTVTLETGEAVRIVRSELLDPVRPIESRHELFWHADQWTQETIGVDLAEQGWEVLGASDPGEMVEPGPPRSSTYVVRRLFQPAGE